MASKDNIKAADVKCYWMKNNDSWRIKQIKPMAYVHFINHIFLSHLTWTSQNQRGSNNILPKRARTLLISHLIKLY